MGAIARLMAPVEQLGEVAEIARAMWRRAMASDVVDHEMADWSQRLYSLAVDQAEREARAGVRL